MLLLLPLLSACVTYYYPALEQDDGVYYAADDPNHAGTVRSDVGLGYYPWWSVDYFYLGYGYRSSGISIGFSTGYPYGYTGWYYDPWYYSHWYAPVYYHPWHGHHGHYAYWHARYRHHRGHHGGGHEGRHDSGHGSDRYADERSRRGRDRGYDEPSTGDFNASRNRSPAADPGDRGSAGGDVRWVTVAPDGGSSDRGMVIGSRDGGKWTRSRLEPVARTPLPGESARSDLTPGQGAAGYSRDLRSVDRGAANVRFPADTKRGNSHTMPIDRDDTRPLVAQRSRSAAGTADNYRVTQPGSGMTARAPADRKASGPRTEPSAPSRQVPARGYSARKSEPPAAATPPRSAGSKSSRSGGKSRSNGSSKPSRSASKPSRERGKRNH